MAYMSKTRKTIIATVPALAVITTEATLAPSQAPGRQSFRQRFPIRVNYSYNLNQTLT